MKTAINGQHIHQKGTKARKRMLVQLAFWMMAVLLILCFSAAVAAADGSQGVSPDSATPTDLRYEIVEGQATFTEKTVQEGTAEPTTVPVESPQPRLNDQTLKEGEEHSGAYRLASELGKEYLEETDALREDLDRTINEVLMYRNNDTVDVVNRIYTLNKLTRTMKRTKRILEGTEDETPKPSAHPVKMTDLCP